MFDLEEAVAAAVNKSAEVEDQEETTEDESLKNNDEVNKEEVEDSQTKKNQQKKYTDEDVNRIVKKKLDQQAKKLEKKMNPLSELEQRELELTKRELKMEAKERLEASQLPPVLAEFMTFDNKEEFEQSYKKIEESLSTMVDQITHMVCGKMFGQKKPVHKSNFNIGSEDKIKSAFAPKNR